MFTDRQIKTLKPKPSPYRVYEKANIPGFCVQVTPKGVKTFNVACTVAGRRKFVNLGRYPSVGLSEARDRARAARDDLERGDSPLSVATNAQRRTGTVRDAVELYLDDMKARNKSSRAEVKRSMEMDVLPEIGDMMARDVRPSHVQQLLAKVIARGVQREHNKVRSKLNAVLNFALRYDHDLRSIIRSVRFGMTYNPVEAVPRDQAAHNRTVDRNLSFQEMAAVINYTGWHPTPYRAVLLILALGGLRPIEVLGMRRAEVDMEQMTFTVPPERFKGRRHHVVPVGEFALTCLNCTAGVKDSYCQIDYFFPAADQEGHYAVASLGQYLDRQHKSGNWPEGVGRFTPYDLRRTFKTRTGEMGIDKTIRDRIQGHAMSDVSSKHYDRWDYLPEKRAALAQWDQRLLECVT